VRDEAGLFQSLRRLRVLLRHSRLVRPEVRSRAVRAVLAWAVLAGLFFMHGAPSSAGCQGGALMAPVTLTVTPVLPAAAPGAAVTGTVWLTAAWLPAKSAVSGTRQSAVPAPPASRATADEHGSCCDGHCSSRQPRQGSGGALAAGPAGAVPLSVAAALVVRCLAVAPRSARPPGRPGLPLPLFLGVSRT
jgi:hypothetical protein